MLDAKKGTEHASVPEQKLAAPASARSHLPGTTLQKPAKVGVLLANLGTPDHHSYWPMRYRTSSCRIGA